jgi:titin
MPDIPGGQSAEASWVLRGDTEGFYTLAAQYSGSLEPLGSPIHLSAATATNALHVWGGSALHLIVDADASAAIGSPYRLRVGMQNVADVPMFNPSLEFLEPGRKNYIYQPEEDLFDATDAIQPGATFFTHYLRLLPEISGNLVTSLSFVKKTAGNVDHVTSEIQSHAAVAGLPVTGTRSGTSVTLSWGAPNVGAGNTINGYRIYFTPTRDTAFGTTPVTTTSASVRTATITKPFLGSYAVSTVVNGVPTMFHKLFGFVPSAPVAPDATPGNASATVDWTAPVNNGGSPITGYVVTPVVGTTPQAPRVFSSPATTQKVAGLVNGTTYTFKVAALNSAGTGTTAIVVGVPIAPTILGVTPGTAQVILKWAAPGNVAPASITKYVVTPYLGTTAQPAQTFASSATTQTVRFLTNDKSYTLRIVAWNSVGAGDSSDDSPLVKVGAPVAPASVKAIPGSNAATVSWNAVAAADTGGASLTGYVITPYLGTTAQTPITSTGTATSKAVALPSGNGKTYTFKVAAKNANSRVGLPASGTAIIVGAPTAPAVNSPAPGANAATVSWTAVPAAQTGGAAITGYVITPYLGATAQTPITSTGTGTSKVVALPSGNGKTYKFKVAAKNANSFTGVPSAFTPSIIVGAPTAPTGLSVSLTPPTTTDGGTTATANVTWNAPANSGGLPLADYVVTATRDTGTAPGDAETLSVPGNSSPISGLVAGERYTFAVVARNTTFTGLPTPAIPSLVVGAPAAPAITTATAGVGQVTLAWSVPANNGSAIVDYLVTPRVAGIALPTLAPVTTASTTITGLIKGAAYTFTVAARNARGIGRDSVATATLKPT